MRHATDEQDGARGRLGEALRRSGWDLALEVVEAGLREDAIPVLARLRRIDQLGDVPTFIAALGRELSRPEPQRAGEEYRLAEQAREHARSREALGFAPRDVVTELLLVRRVLWQFVSARRDELAGADAFEVARRLDDTIDRLVAESVGAYFDRATEELAERARRDALTGLLNHQAFADRAAEELERAQRYDHGLALVFMDMDGFKQVNDTHGHAEGDRALRRVATTVQAILRASDAAGRLGGDEFAVLLIEAADDAAAVFLERLEAELPPGLAISAGAASYPGDATTVEDLLRLADERQYAAKRGRQRVASR